LKDATKKTVLFLSNGDESALAQTLFEAEAKRTDVGWAASSRTVALEGVESVDLQNTDLIILIDADSKTLQQPFSAWKGEVEVWKVSSASDSLQTIRQNVTNLVVRLILKGGKRAAIPSAPPVEQPRQTQVTSAAQKSAIRVMLDSKARRGKKVTVVSGLPLNETALEELAAALKQSCGSGGTVKDGQIEIQGDHRDKVMAQLQNRGYKPKRAGG